MPKQQQSQAGDWGVSFWTRLVRDGKVVQGKDGWLFLANDSNDVLRQHTGERALTLDEVEAWRALLQERVERLSQTGARYFFLVAPDTHSVYAEKLPDEIDPVAERSIHKLTSHLAEAGSPVQLIYPLDEMLAHKERRQVCSPYDTHWSEFGSLIAYTRLIEEIKKQVPIRQVDPKHVVFATKMMPGELSLKLGFDGDVAQVTAELYTRARLLEDNLVMNRGAYAVTECEPAPPTTCVLFGDSYSYAVLRYLSESFGRFVFAHLETIDYELVERERPDVVISLMAERFLIQVPDDRTAPRMSELARSKLDNGAVRQPLHMWEGRPETEHELVPLETVERIRAQLLSEGNAMDAALVSALAYAGRDVVFGEVPDSALLEWQESVLRPPAAAVGANGVTLEDLRDCFGALLVRAGAGFEEVAERTGFAPHRVLERYGHLVDAVHRDGPVPAEDQIRAARASASLPREPTPQLR